MTIKLDSRQIVKRILASSNQLDDSLEPSFRTGNLDCRARCQAECAKTGDERQIKRLIAPVVWDIEKCGFPLGAFAHRATSPESARFASCSRGRFLFARHAMGRSLARFRCAVAGDLIRERRQSAHAGFRDTVNCGEVFRTRKWRLDYNSLHIIPRYSILIGGQVQTVPNALHSTHGRAVRSRKNRIGRRA